MVQYTFDNLISGRHHDDEKGWIDTPEPMRAEALDAFRAYLTRETRAGSQNRLAVNAMRLDLLPPSYGIFGRLVWYPETGVVQYIAGQDHTSEMRTIRELIRKGMAR